MGAFLSTGLALGLLLFTGLIVWYGAGEIAAALAAGGAALFAVAGFHLLPLLADALGWRRLFGARRPPLSTATFARWLGESVNTLLPVMQIGGSIVRAQHLVRRGVAAEDAAASVVVDVTLVVATQVLFTLAGLAVLPLLLGGDRLLAQALAGATLLALATLAFYAVQRRGLFTILTRMAGRAVGQTRWAALRLDAAALDAAVARTYRNRRAVLAGAAWHLASWVFGVGEVWLALWALGHPVGLGAALLLESLGQAVRAAAFAIPGALGIQEGGYLVLGAVAGIGPETALALSLAKRFREVVLGVPGLVAWQIVRRRG
jgi:putative membrane protein